MRNITNIPAPRVAFIDERTGLMSREWYRFFLNLFVLTGSGNSDVTIEDLQKSPIADVVVPVVDVLPATSVVVDNTETQLAVLSAKYDEISDRLEDLQLSVPPAGSGGSVTKVSVVTANGLAGTVANSTTTPEITLSTTETGILTGNGTSISNAVIGTGLQYASSTLSINATTGTEILRGNGSGQFSNITVGTGLQYASSTLSIKGLTGGTAIQYENGAAGFAPVTIGSGLSFVGGTLSNTSPGVGTVTNVSVVSANGLAGTVSNPTTTPAITLSTTQTGVLTGNGTSISTATIGTGLQYSSSTLSINATTGTDILRGNGSGQFSNITVGTGLQYASSTLSIQGLTGGTAIQYENGALGFAPVTIGTGLSFVGGTLSNTANGTVTSVTATAPIASTGGTTPVISMPAASASANGYLTSIDWSTFNNKGLGSVTSVSVVSANGLSGTVTNPTTTPAITLNTTQTGVLTGNGSSISTATIGTGLQYVSSTLSIKGLTSTLDTILASDGTGGVKSIFIGTGLNYASGTLSNTANGTVTSVTATSPIASTGGNTPVISMPAATTSVSGYLTNTDWNTFNNKGSGTVTSVTGTSPVVSSGGTTPAISIPAATTSVSGYLTNTDWNTFNNKQPAGSYLVSGGALGTPSSGTLTNVTGLPLSTGVTGLLPITNGGTGTATPALVAGTNVSITGSWPNQTINSTASGGTGTVTSVSVVSANGLAGTVSNPTTTPAITLSTTANGLLTGNGTSISTAVIGTGLQYASSTLSINATTGTDILRGNGSGQFANVSIGTGLQYSSSTISIKGLTSTLDTILASDGTGGVKSIFIGTGLNYASGTLSNTANGTVTNTSGSLTANSTVVGNGTVDVKTLNNVKVYAADTVVTGTAYGKVIYNAAGTSWLPSVTGASGAGTYADKFSYFPVIGLSSRGTAAQNWGTYVQDYLSLGLTDATLYNSHYNTWAAVNGIPAGLASSASPGGSWNDPPFSGGAPTDPYYTEIGGYAVTLGIGTKGNYAEGIGVVVKDSPVFGGSSVEARLTGMQLAVTKDNPNNTWKSIGYNAYSDGAQQTTYAPLAAFYVAGGWQYGLDLSAGSYNGASINFPSAAITTGASTGTYVGTNKPGANSSNVWLVVKVNGTNYYLPAWT